MRNRSAGFSLTEMLVTAAILGILLAIGIPAYQGQVQHARQNEAQVSLSQVYTAERSFYTDMGSFTAALGGIGVSSSEHSVRYYAYGFGTLAGGSNCGPVTTNLQLCTYYRFDRDGAGVATYSGLANTDGSTFFSANVVSTQGDTAITTAAGMSAGASTINPSTYTFTAMAIGYISTLGLTDVWQIDNNRSLVNTSPGL